MLKILIITANDSNEREHLGSFIDRCDLCHNECRIDIIKQENSDYLAAHSMGCSPDCYRCSLDVYTDNYDGVLVMAESGVST